MNEPLVRVLLATYNGEAYIRQMVDSVLNQDYPNIQIILSDDNSKDSSPSILQEYADAHPDTIVHYKSGMRFGCAQNHFMHLLSKFCDADYIMFCDQDDVWHTDKVRKTLDTMRRIEAEPSVPCMVHTDLRVVDRDLAEIAPSFCMHSNLDGNRMALNQILVQNVVTGCTMMLNRSLAQLACREVDMSLVLMHDMWIALIAAAFGKTAFLNEATIDYRQHGNNSVGAKDVNSAGYLLKRLGSQKMRSALDNSARQADAFARTYADMLNNDQIALLNAFSGTVGASLLSRDCVYVKYKLYKFGLTRIVAQFLGL